MTLSLSVSVLFGKHRSRWKTASWFFFLYCLFHFYTIDNGFRTFARVFVLFYKCPLLSESGLAFLFSRSYCFMHCMCFYSRRFKTWYSSSSLTHLNFSFYRGWHFDKGARWVWADENRGPGRDWCPGVSSQQHWCAHQQLLSHLSRTGAAQWH